MMGFEPYQYPGLITGGLWVLSAIPWWASKFYEMRAKQPPVKPEAQQHLYNYQTGVMVIEAARKVQAEKEKEYVAALTTGVGDIAVIDTERKQADAAADAAEEETRKSYEAYYRLTGKQPRQRKKRQWWGDDASKARALYLLCVLMGFPVRIAYKALKALAMGPGTGAGIRR